MNFFSLRDCNVQYNEYVPHKFDNEEFRKSRNNSQLYNFSKSNPFDDNIDWKKFNEHYKNGTLNHDYKIRYKPILKYINSINPKQPDDESKAAFKCEENNKTNNNKENIKLFNVSFLQQLRPKNSESQKKNALPDLELNFNNQEQLKKCALETKNGQKQAIRSSVLLETKTNTTGKNLNYLCLPWKKKNIKKSSYLSTSKKKNMKSVYKNTFYTSIGCTAVLSTMFLATTATVFPPLLPALLPFLLPVSVATNGIILFKAKRIVSKLKKNIYEDVIKFKIHCKKKNQSFKINSKRVFQKIKSKNLFKSRRNNKANPIWSESPFLDDAEIQQLLAEGIEENQTPYKYKNLSLLGDFDNNYKQTKTFKSLKKKNKKRETLIFKIFDDTSEDETETSKSTTRSNVLEKYLKPKIITNNSMTEIDLSKDKKLEFKHCDIAETNENSACCFTSKNQYKDDSRPTSKNIGFNIHRLPLDSQKLEALKNTTTDFCSYFRL